MGEEKTKQKEQKSHNKKIKKKMKGIRGKRFDVHVTWHVRDNIDIAQILSIKSENVDKFAVLGLSPLSHPSSLSQGFLSPLSRRAKTLKSCFSCTTPQVSKFSLSPLFSLLSLQIKNRGREKKKNKGKILKCPTVCMRFVFFLMCIF